MFSSPSHVYYLNPVELIERQSEKVHGVIDERGVRVQVAVLEVEASALVELGADNVADHLLHLWLVDVHQAESCEVRPAVLRVRRKRIPFLKSLSTSKKLGNNTETDTSGV